MNQIKVELPEEPITAEELKRCLFVRPQLEKLARWCDSITFDQCVTGCFVRVLGPDRNTLVLDRVQGVQEARTVAGMRIERKLRLQLMGEQLLVAVSNRVPDEADIERWWGELQDHRMLPDRAFLTRKYAEILEQMRMADEQEKREREREERKKLIVLSDSDHDLEDGNDSDTERPLVPFRRKRRLTPCSSSSTSSRLLLPSVSEPWRLTGVKQPRRPLTAPSSPEGTPIECKQDLLPAMLSSLQLMRMRKYLDFEQFHHLACSSFVRVLSGAHKKIDLIVGVLAYSQPYNFHGQLFDKRFQLLWSNICRLNQIVTTPEQTLDTEFDAWLAEMRKRRRALPTKEFVQQKREAFDEALGRIETEHGNDPDYPQLQPPRVEDDIGLFMMPLLLGDSDDDDVYINQNSSKMVGVQEVHLVGSSRTSSEPDQDGMQVMKRRPSSMEDEEEGEELEEHDDEEDEDDEDKPDDEEELDYDDEITEEKPPDLEQMLAAMRNSDAFNACVLSRPDLLRLRRAPDFERLVLGTLIRIHLRRNDQQDPSLHFILDEIDEVLYLEETYSLYPNGGEQYNLAFRMRNFRGPVTLRRMFTPRVGWQTDQKLTDRAFQMWLGDLKKWKCTPPSEHFFVAKSRELREALQKLGGGGDIKPQQKALTPFSSPKVAADAHLVSSAADVVSAVLSRPQLIKMLDEMDFGQFAEAVKGAFVRVNTRKYEYKLDLVDSVSEGQASYQLQKDAHPCRALLHLRVHGPHRINAVAFTHCKPKQLEYEFQTWREAVQEKCLLLPKRASVAEKAAFLAKPSSSSSPQKSAEVSDDHNTGWGSQNSDPAQKSPNSDPVKADPDSPADAADVRRITLHTQDFLNLAPLGTVEMRRIVHGCFVRMFAHPDPDAGTPVHKLHQVNGLQSGSYYRLRNATIDKHLIVNGSDQPVSCVMVSNKLATEAEFDEWAQCMEASGIPLPTKAFVQNKAELLEKTLSDGASASAASASSSSQNQKQESSLKRRWTPSSSSASVDRHHQQKSFRTESTNRQRSFYTSGYGRMSSANPQPLSASDSFQQLGFSDTELQSQQRNNQNQYDADWTRRAETFIARVKGRPVEQIQVRLERSAPIRPYSDYGSQPRALPSTGPRMPNMFINDNKSKKDDDGEEEEEEEDSDEADGPGVRAARQRIVVQDMESMDNDNSRTLNNSHRTNNWQNRSNNLKQFEQQWYNNNNGGTTGRGRGGGNSNNSSSDFKQFEQRWYNSRSTGRGGNGATSSTSSANLTRRTTTGHNNNGTNTVAAVRPMGRTRENNWRGGRPSGQQQFQHFFFD